MPRVTTMRWGSGILIPRRINPCMNVRAILAYGQARCLWMVTGTPAAGEAC